MVDGGWARGERSSASIAGLSFIDIDSLQGALLGLDGFAKTTVGTVQVQWTV